jgi:hypothetical protein
MLLWIMDSDSGVGQAVKDHDFGMLRMGIRVEMQMEMGLDMWLEIREYGCGFVQC